jgi:prepilin-type N-terminal cleavage/methylation domain-containing protein
VKKGLTLIELMIVVAICAIIASIIIPNIMRSKVMLGNEKAVINDLKSILSAQKDFQASSGHFAADMKNLKGIPDTVWRDRHGYSFRLVVVNDGFIVIADPVRTGRTGSRYFFADKTGIIRSSKEAPADVNSPPISDGE